MAIALPVIEIDSWETFLREIANRVGANPRGYCFRGQSKFEEWTLKPFLLRLLGSPPRISASEALQLEKTVADQFILRSGSQVTNLCGRDPFSRLAVMQHFRAPTRLLDWTFSPYVAAYFAVEKNWDEDGAIWFFDSLSTHIHTGGFFRMRDVNRPKTVSGPITFQMTPNWEETEVSGSFTYFRVLTNSYGFERLVAQQGLFTISAYILDDHEDVLQGVIDRFGNNDNRIVGKMRMPHTLKPEFLRQLREMNISANALFPGMDDTVFPSMDGIGRSMTELVRSRVISTPQDRGSPPSPSGTEK